ncbi:hypothetical protein NQD34_011317 [Periophthalmus magnuspinnatus]|nr:hypothetical protein NQD34_011317 [Periophthalmus magnuspinnatus]
MGKPLSRPDCLRKNPSCMGKGEEEDLNIDDCYVPQRSMYDTVRLNEQIDSSSKGSLASRHFTGTLPYTQRPLDFSSLCGNGVLSASSSFELRTRKAAMLDERAVFDGLKLNGNIIRASDTVLPKSRLQGGEKKDFPHHRRSWRAFAPTNLGEYISRSGTLCSGSSDRPALLNGRRGQSMTSSLTSEEDSGLYSPTVDRERHAHHPNKRVGPGTRSLSSSEAMHMSGELKTGRSLSSGQEDFLYSPARDSVSLYHSHSLVQEGRHNKLSLKGKDRFSSGSGSRVQSLGWRSKRDYEEQSTAELLEDVPSAEDCELVSVVVTQPETYGTSVTLPIESRQRTITPNPQLGASRYSLEELEEFLQSVEACLPKCLEELQQAGEHEIEFFLNAIAACSDIDTGPLSPQVPKIRPLLLWV